MYNRSNRIFRWNKIKLESYEMICPYCNGEGHLHSNPDFGTCVKCLGDGKIDWVQNIVGKDIKDSLIGKDYLW